MKTNTSASTVPAKKTSLFLNHNFLLLWGGQTISTAGDVIFNVTLTLWIATVITRGQNWAPLAVSGLFLVQFIPLFTIGPLAGVFIDRWNKRRTMLWMDALRAMLILLLFLVDRQRSIFLLLSTIYAVTLLTGICSLFFNPSRLALISDVVSESDLSRAIGFTQVSANLTNLICPPLASLLFFTFGVQWAFLIDSFSFVISFLIMLVVYVPRIATDVISRREGRIFLELKEGLRLCVNDKFIRLYISAGFLITFGGSSFLALNVFFVTQNLHVSASLYGLAGTALGAGGIIGAIFVSVFANRIGIVKVVWGSTIMLGIMTITYARMASFAPALLVIFLIGAANDSAITSGISLCLSNIPRDFFGRVISVFMPLNSIAATISAAISGYLVGNVLRGFHTTLLGMVFGPLDTIFVVGGLLIIISGIYEMINLRNTLSTVT